MSGLWTRGGGTRAHRVFALAAVALVALSAILLVAPVFLPQFSCRSFVGMPSLGLGPHPMIERPAACLFGNDYAFLGIGLAGLLVALGWAIARRSAGLAVLAGTAALAGGAWSFFAVGGPSILERVLRHLPRLP